MDLEPEHTYAEAAALLGVSESFLRENIARLPHYKKSLSKKGRGAVTFSDVHIMAIFKLFEREPTAPTRLTPLSRRRED